MQSTGFVARSHLSVEEERKWTKRVLFINLEFEETKILKNHELFPNGAFKL